MAPRRPHRAALLGGLLALTFAGLAGCGGNDEHSDEPFREGLAEELGGLEYNVFITRQLNLALPEDRAYYDGPGERKDFALYGVFLQVCNPVDANVARRASSEFKIVDSQGEEFEPTPLPHDNAFAYPLDEGKELGEEEVPEEAEEPATAPPAQDDTEPGSGDEGERTVPEAAPLPETDPLMLEPGACLPASGSVAQLGPTAGVMLLFELPRANVENRPIELEVESGGEHLAFELDF